MDVTTIAQAVTTLRQQGNRVSVRQVHRMIGGGFRDISYYLKKLSPEGQEEATMVPVLPPTTPAAARLSWQEVYQAAQAVRHERRQSLWTHAGSEPTPARLMSFFDSQHRFRPPICLWELWGALRPAVTAPQDIVLLDLYVEALRRQQAIWSDTREQRQLALLWTRLMDPTR